MFTVEFSSAAKKFLKKPNKRLAIRILESIKKLAEDPFPSGVKKVVKRKEKIYRIRVGDYRIQHSVFYDRNLFFITDIEKRSRAY